MIRFFTWHDIKMIFEEHRMSWPRAWVDVKVYTDCVVICFDPDTHVKKQSCEYLKTLFTRNYNIEEDKILIDFTMMAFKSFSQAY